MNAAGSILPIASFPDSALRLLLRRSLLLPALALLLALVATNAGALLYPFVPGSSSIITLLLTLLVRIVAVFTLSVAILRIAVDSPRGAWAPDGAFWLYALLISLAAAVPALLQILVGDIGSMRTGLIANVAAVVLMALLAPWIVAAAVARPLAAQPVPWLRRFGRWLPHRIGWGLLLLVPLGALQTYLALLPLEGTVWFWPAAAGGGTIACLILMIRLGLDAAAYRRVAQD